MELNLAKNKLIKNQNTLIIQNKVIQFIFCVFSLFIFNSFIFSYYLHCETKSVSQIVQINNNGKTNKIDLDFINNVRYIDISKIPNNIIENSQYNSDNYTITSKDIKIQFLPGSFYYTIDNLEEVKIVQMYMPIISKVVNKKNQLIVPFVSFLKSLDSIGLYDIKFDNNSINITSKVSKNEFIVNFALKFPKLNIDKNDLTNINNLNDLNREYQNSKIIEEDFWDEDNNKYAQDNYKKSNEVNENLDDNEIAMVINNIAKKVFGSIKAIDENTKNLSFDTEDNKINRDSKSGVKSGGTYNRFKSYFPPKYARRKAYTDPFLELRPVSENDNIRFKVDKGNNKKEEDKISNELDESNNESKQVNNSKKVLKNKNVNIDKNLNDKNEKKTELKTEEPNLNTQIKKEINENYYIPKNLKRPGIDF